MVSKKKKVGILIALTLGAIGLLKTIQKEQEVLQKEKIVQVEKAKKEEAPELFKSKVKKEEVVVDAGVDLAPMIARLIEVAKRLERLEESVGEKGELLGPDKDNMPERNSDFVLYADQEISTFLADFIKLKSTAEIERCVNYFKYASMVFENSIERCEGNIDRYKKEIRALEDFQQDIDTVRSMLKNLERTPKVKELDNRLDKLEKELYATIDLYNQAKETEEKVLGMYQKGLEDIKREKKGL